MRVSVVFTPEAEAQLLSLYRFIAARATPAVAQRYVSERQGVRPRFCP